MFDPNRIPAVTAIEAQRRLATAADGPVDPALGAGDLAPLLVDVREVHEIVRARATGVVVMPLSTFMIRHQELPKDRPLLMICRTGQRSAQATAFLLANGWTDVTNVAGGTVSWEQSGLEIRSGPLDPGEGDLPD